MSEAYKIQDYQIEDKKQEQSNKPNGNYQNKTNRHKLPIHYKITYVLCTVVIVFLAFYSIDLENQLTAISTNIQKEEKIIDKKKVNVKELQQEKNDLSRVDRIMKKAKEAGLKNDNNNIRTVE